MEFLEALQNFIPNADLIGIQSFGNGHINSTFILSTQNDGYFIVQKINNYVFKDVDMLMNNIAIVTKHLKNKNIETIEMLTAKNGKNYIEFEGSYYRMYQYLPNTITFEATDSLEMVENAASAFGKFHNFLADLDATKLGEIIPHFHDTPKRYLDLKNSIKLDKHSRVKNCEKEIGLINNYSSYLSLIMDGINSGEVNLHITHNDPKINNALFDCNTKLFRSIIDLDTVMPGSVLFDFGDALRSLFTGDKEDSKDYEKVVGNFEIFTHYTKKYYEETRQFLTKREIQLLPYAPFILSMECGIRFLEDYLKGDVYFKTNYQGHNLDRARTQINLAISIIENIDAYKEIVDKIISE